MAAKAFPEAFPRNIIVIHKDQQSLPYKSIQLRNETEHELYGKVSIHYSRLSEEYRKRTVFQHPTLSSVIEPTCIILSEELTFKQNCPTVANISYNDLQPKDPNNVCALTNGDHFSLYLPTLEICVVLKLWKNKAHMEQGRSCDYVQSFLENSKFTYQTIPTFHYVKAVFSTNEEEVKRCCLIHKPQLYVNQYMYFPNEREHGSEPYRPAIGNEKEREDEILRTLDGVVNDTMEQTSTNLKVMERYLGIVLKKMFDGNIGEINFDKTITNIYKLVATGNDELILNKLYEAATNYLTGEANHLALHYDLLRPFHHVWLKYQNQTRPLEALLFPIADFNKLTNSKVTETLETAFSQTFFKADDNPDETVVGNSMTTTLIYSAVRRTIINLALTTQQYDDTNMKKLGAWREFLNKINLKVAEKLFFSIDCRSLDPNDTFAVFDDIIFQSIDTYDIKHVCSYK